MEGLQQSQPKNNARLSSILPFVLVSALVHGVIVWLLNSLDQRESSPPVTDKKIIQAQLVTINLAHQANPPDVQPNHQLDASTVPVKPEKQPDTTALPDRRVSLPAIHSPPDVQQPSKDKPTDAQAAARNRISRDLAKEHLRQQMQRSEQRMAQDAVRQYQQQKASPELRIPEFDPFTTEDEKFLQQQRVRVNCQSALNKTIATLSSITGGALKCSSSADITPYINKHVNKTPEPQH